GAIADRHGARRVLVILSFMTAAALALLSASGLLLWLAAAAAIIFRAMAQPLVPPVVAAAFPGPARVPALARQATWRDIGAGTGPLVAGIAFPLLPTFAIYGGAALMVVAVTVVLARAAGERTSG
ncbi:MAG: hypothetical protein KDJ41_11370, partial [Hyphomicrobiaceae bacterium]|nr:hypothetical protein [Hyphomicrobiaceae bacterium]